MEENNKHIDQLVNETLESLDNFQGIRASAAFEQRVIDSVLKNDSCESLLIFKYVVQVVVLLLIVNILVIFAQVKRVSQPALRSQNSILLSEGSCPEIYRFLLEDGA